MIPDTMRISVLLAPGEGLLDFSPSPADPPPSAARACSPSRPRGTLHSPSTGLLLDATRRRTPLASGSIPPSSSRSQRLPGEARRREPAKAAIRKLPARPADRTCGGSGVGTMCPVCGLPVTKDQLEFEMLTEGRLPLAEGISEFVRGTGRPCAACHREIEPSEVEREVQGAGVFHEACYEIWWEDSSTRHIDGTYRAHVEG